MRTLNKSSQGLNSAEARFRAAFDRLKTGVTQNLPKGTKVSQNNVAKEAGCDSSALRKHRFPILVLEIQEWISSNENTNIDSERQKSIKKQRKNRDLRQTIIDLKLQRDAAASLLIDANSRIVDLSEQLESARKELEKLRPSSDLIILKT